MYIKMISRKWRIIEIITVCKIFETDRAKHQISLTQKEIMSEDFTDCLYCRNTQE